MFCFYTTKGISMNYRKSIDIILTMIIQKINSKYYIIKTKPQIYMYFHIFLQITV